jgi:hypothetical protein
MTLSNNLIGSGSANAYLAKLQWLAPAIKVQFGLYKDWFRYGGEDRNAINSWMLSDMPKECPSQVCGVLSKYWCSGHAFSQINQSEHVQALHP